MRVLVSSDENSAKTSIREALQSSVSRCVVVGSCSIDALADQVAQHRPDVVIVGFTADCDAALQAIAEAQEAYPARILAAGPTSDAKLTGRMLDDEGVLGTIHIGIGTSHALGGNVVAPTHYDLLMWEPKIEIDGTVVQRGSEVLV